MDLSPRKKELLKQIPGVDTLLEALKSESLAAGTPQTVIVNATRMVIGEVRNRILSMEEPGENERELMAEGALLKKIHDRIKKEMTPNLRRVINATGIVVHTNLGRSLLAAPVIEELKTIAGCYSNLEFNLETGRRGLRYTAVEKLICGVTGCEAAMVVNNNAAAVLLCLDSISRGREVVLSRGELVEIGGSFRIPDVMKKSGSLLREVGTTNRTHLKDYENAITNETTLLMKVHTSNYAIIGFTKSVSLQELVQLGNEKAIPVMEDLGSGTFVDLSRYGLAKERTVQESVAAGAHLVTFSGDKLLGGPQAGIICGKKELIETIRMNPLTRALRIDKLTLTALEHTLRLYLDPERAVNAIPTLHLLTLPYHTISAKADTLIALIDALSHPRVHATGIDLFSKAGGGSLPELNLPTRCVALSIQGISPNRIESLMRKNPIPVIGRIENDLFLMDMRSVMEDELDRIRDAVQQILFHEKTSLPGINSLAFNEMND